MTKWQVAECPVLMVGEIVEFSLKDVATEPLGNRTCAIFAIRVDYNDLIRFISSSLVRIKTKTGTLIIEEYYLA
jgi:hypothetical protein